jgi:hypothetical protein
MLLRLITFGFVENRETELPISEPVKPEMLQDRNVAGNEADLRRQMYERIARGNALIEAEENAQRMWRGD